MAEQTHVVGLPLPRVDAAEKVTGRARYLDDYAFPGMLELACVMSPHPHADVISIDPGEALKMPGVVGVLAARDVPGANQVGCVSPDQPLLAFERVRFVGDRVALVVAKDRETARAAAKLVKVEYRPLPGVHDPEEALAESAPKLHPGGNLVAHLKVRFGNAREAMAGCEVVVEETFEVNYQEHAYLEPQAAAAVPDEQGITIFGSMQCPFYVQKGVAPILGVDKNRVRVVQTTTGGAFGGKEDYPTEVAACAAVAAARLGRPVKNVYDRSQDIQVSTKRHRMRLKYRVGATRTGRLQALDCTIHVDAGAYAGLSVIVAERSNSTAAGPYYFPHAHVDTLVVYTNNLFGGAFRGFGNPQVTFAMEMMMDKLAAVLAMDPVELRRMNLLHQGMETITGQPLPPSAPAAEILDDVLAQSDFRRLRAEAEEFNRTSRWTRRGVGLALSMYGCCLHAGGQHLEGSAALVQVRSDGSVEVSIGGTEMGQGAFTVMAQIASEVLGAPFEKVRALPTDTALVPDSGPTVASRTTVMSGNAVRHAALQLGARLKELAGAELGCPASAVSVRPGAYAGAGREITFAALADLAFRRKVNLFAAGWYAPPPKPWDKETGQGTAYVTYCFTGHVALVEVDLVGGIVTVKRLFASHDVGRVMNPALAEGQAHGGMVQGMGWAVSENLQVDKGRALNAGLTDYLIPTSLDMPELSVRFVEAPFPDGPFGAKGLGEPSLISVPTAVVAAAGHAMGQLPTTIPVTPETILRWSDAGNRNPGR